VKANGLRILQVCSSDSWGGMEMHVAVLSELLQQRGHAVLVATKPGSPLAQRCERAGLSVTRFEGGKYVAPAETARMATLLRRFQPDVVHVHYSRDLWQVVPALSGISRVPLVFVKHIGTQKPKRDLLHRYLYGRVDFAIAISRVIEENLLATHPLGRGKVGVIYHGVDVADFQRRARAREDVRRSLGFSPETLVVGTLGRLEPHKGHLEFIAAAEKVLERVPEAEFLVVGGPTRGEEEKAEVIYDRWRRSPIREKIHFAGFREDVPEVLSAMDIFVFPSHAEAFGLVLIEAMAAGLPIVTSNCDGVLDVVEDGVNGFMLDPTDVDGIAEKIVLLAQDLQLRKRFAGASLALAQKRFDLNRMADEIEHLYRKLIQKRTTGVKS